MKRALVILGASLAVAGCGFHPMYGGGKLGPELASIYVEPVAENDGYELRNQLIDLLGSDGRETGKSYFLNDLMAKEVGVNDARFLAQSIRLLK